MPPHPSSVEALSARDLAILTRQRDIWRSRPEFTLDDPLVGLESAQVISGSGAPSTSRRLNVAEFGKSLSAAVRVGYGGHCIGVAHRGKLLYSWNDGFARQYRLRWSAGVQMHIASMTKLVTAVAMLHCLDSFGLTANSEIGPFLPEFWQVPQEVRAVTFAQLFTHTSRLPLRVEGFSGNLNTFEGLQRMTEAGLEPSNPATSDYAYSNSAYALMRVLISTVGRAISVADKSSFVEWDSRTRLTYENYVRRFLLEPANLQGPRLDSTTTSALVYPHPYAPYEEGHDQGAFQDGAGGVGWYFSVREYLAFLGALESGAIISRRLLNQLKESQFGARITQYGDHTLHQHGGAWSSAGTSAQCFFIMAPNDLQIVVMANSETPHGDSRDYPRFQQLTPLTLNAYAGNLTANAPHEPNQVVSLISVRSNRALTIENGRDQPAVPVVQQPPAGSLSQQFRLVPNGTSSVSIASAHSGLAIEPTHGAADNGRLVTQYPWSGRYPQRFRVNQAPDGTVRFAIRRSSDEYLALTPQNASQQSGAPVRVETTPSQADVVATPAHRWWVATTIRSASRNVVFDVSGGLGSADPRIIAFAPHDGANQLFSIQQVSDQWVKIVALDGRVFDVSGASQASGAPVILYDWHGGHNQQFAMTKNSQGQVNFRARHSGFFLHMQSTSGGPIIQSHPLTSTQYNWLLHPLHLQPK